MEYESCKYNRNNRLFEYTDERTYGKGAAKMNQEFTELFINQIEELIKASAKEESIHDETGTYSKVTYLEHLIVEARELMKYGESKIALENMLENLNEASILLDKSVIDFARQAFNGQVTRDLERLMNALVKNK